MGTVLRMCFVQTLQRVQVNCSSEGQRGFYKHAARGQNKFRHSHRSKCCVVIPDHVKTSPKRQALRSTLILLML